MYCKDVWIIMFVHGNFYFNGVGVKQGRQSSGMPAGNAQPQDGHLQI